jgi:orotate phosphoribosyltransferase-like protein
VTRGAKTWDLHGTGRQRRLSPLRRAALVAQAQALRAQGETLKAISVELKVSDTTISNWTAGVERTDLKQRERDLRNEEIRRLRQQGLSYRTIGQRLHCSPDTVWKAIQRGS